jgi:serine/threonine-protein kinase ATR
VKQQEPFSYKDYVFWQRAQTPNTWADSITMLIVDHIDNLDTYSLLSFINGSIKYNNEIASFVLPYVFLHFLLETPKKQLIDNAIIKEFEFIFDIIRNEKKFKRVQNLDEFKYKYLGDAYFVPHKQIKQSDIVQTPNEFLNAAKQIAKHIFEVMDFLSRYQYQSAEEDPRINNLLNKFHLKTLAEVSYNCGDYQRALIQYESYLTGLNDEQREEEWAFLVHIFAKLGDYDSIAGVADKRKYPWSATDKMYIGNITGNWEDHMVCIEEIIREPANISVEVIASTVNCLVSYNNCEQAIVVADRMLSTLYASCKDDLNRYEDVKSAALLRLSRFDELEKIIDVNSDIDTSIWGNVEAKLLLKLRSQDGFDEEMKQVRLNLMENFKCFESNQSNYTINYDSIVRLHMLTDVDKTNLVIQQIMTNVPNKNEVIKSFFDEIKARKKFFKLTPMQSESLLALHRTLFKEIKHTVNIKMAPNEANEIFRVIDTEIGKNWMECAIVFQDQHDQANAFLIEAEKYKPPGLFVQKAKLVWRKNKGPSQATKILKFHCDELEKTQNYLDNPFYAKGLLLIARYNGEAAAVDFQTNKNMYKKALTAKVDRDKAYLHYAEYLDRTLFLNVEKEPEVNTIDTEKLKEILEAYGSGLLYSTEYVFQALPRFLQIWFDATVPRVIHQSNMMKRKSTGVSSHNAQLNAIARKFAEQLKPFQFYTAFSQLISRICHPCPEVYGILKTIISKLFEKYPRHSLWYVVHAMKSKMKLASDRMKEIFRTVPRHKMLVADFESYIDRMMDISRVQEPRGLEGHPKKVNTTLSKIKSRLLMPLQHNLQILNETIMNNLTDDDQIFIYRMNDEITMLRSMQKPKKVSFVCSNGQNYTLLVKSKDDLRIDFRFMEFCKVLNDYFRKDREASQRFFSIRTYSVSPINEDIGMIEFLKNVETLKNVIHDQYQR